MAKIIGFTEIQEKKEPIYLQDIDNGKTFILNTLGVLIILCIISLLVLCLRRRHYVF